MPKEKEKIKNRDLKVKDLIETHEDYQHNEVEWRFLLAIYEGIRKIIKLKLVTKHERESEIAYNRRLEELYGFGYSKSVVEVLTHYLFKKPASTTLGSLQKDKLWKLFFNDSNLYGDNYDKVIMDTTNYAAVLGHMGILVDKANVELVTKDEQISKKVYPYLAIYFPSAILDWVWAKDDYHRPYLSYLKLEDDNDQYRLWFTDHWEIWELPEDGNGEKTKANQEADAVFIDSAPHELGLIPFIWHYNLKSRKRAIGESDIHEVSRLDLSIIRNASQIEEIIYYASFPMMRKPKRDASPVTGTSVSQTQDEVGVEVILEFDPEHPESKPDWLSAEVAQPVDSCLKWIEKKVSEIYRAANIGGLAATEPTSNPQSGVAKKIDFQMLNSKMVNKAINLQDTDNAILELYLRWENLWDRYKDEVYITREKQFDIEDIAGDLENALTAQLVVQSKAFSMHLQKAIARKMMPTLNEDEISEVDEEIENNTEEPGLGSTKESTYKEEVDNDLESGDGKNKSIIDQGLNQEQGD